jgi:adenylate cyclase
MSKRFRTAFLLGTLIPAFVFGIDLLPLARDAFVSLRHGASDLLFVLDWQVDRFLHPPMKVEGREAYLTGFKGQSLLKDDAGRPLSPTVVVRIDEQTLRPGPGKFRSVEQMRWDHPRLIENLAARGVRSIAFDVDFSNEHAADAKLAHAMAAAGNVILGCRVDGDTLQEALENMGAAPDESKIVRPTRLLEKSALALGFFNHPVDPDGRIRRTTLWVDALPIHSIDLVASSAYLLGGKQIDIRRTGGSLTCRNQVDEWVALPQQMPIRFLDYPASGRRVPIVSYDSVLNSAATTGEILDIQGNPVHWKDRIAWIGAMSPILHDEFLTPLCTLPRFQVEGGEGRHGKRGGAAWLFPTRHRYGVEIHAYAVNTLYETAMDHGEGNRAFGEGPRWLDFLLCLVLGVIIAFIGAERELKISAPLSLLVLGLFWAAATWIFRSWWVIVDAFSPTAAGGLIFVVTAYLEYSRQRAYRNQIRSMFEHFAPAHVVRLLESDPSFLHRAGQRRELTVLFSDIRDFTSLSEEMSPEDVVEMLNTYFTRMVEVIIRHGGRIDKFVGDAIMAVFGDPATSDNPARDSVLAALEMATAVRSLRTEWRFSRNFRIGVGINTGEMVVGHLGGARKKEYTVIGDAVNVASRLEGLTKQHGEEIIISGETRSRLEQGFPARLLDLGQTAVKGKSLRISIFGVQPPGGAAPAPVP